MAVKKYNFEEENSFNTFIREIDILQWIKFKRKEKVFIEMFGVTRVKKDEWWIVMGWIDGYNISKDEKLSEFGMWNIPF